MIAAWMVFSVVTGCAFTAAAIAAQQLASLGRQPRRFVWLAAMVVTTSWPAMTLLRGALFPVRDPAAGLLAVSGVQRLSAIIVSAPAWGVSRYWVAFIVLAWGMLSTALLARLVFAVRYIRRRQATWRPRWRQCSHRCGRRASSDRATPDARGTSRMDSGDGPATSGADTPSRGRTPDSRRPLSIADRHITHGPLPVESGAMVSGEPPSDRDRDRLRQSSSPSASKLARVRPLAGHDRPTSGGYDTTTRPCTLRTHFKS